jgi:putative salt-induced outer membrane protein
MTAAAGLRAPPESHAVSRRGACVVSLMAWAAARLSNRCGRHRSAEGIVRRLGVIGGFLMAALALPAHAEKARATPQSLAELGTMIREAHPQERKAIVNVAKRLYPGSIAEIDAIVRESDKESRAAMTGEKFRKGWKGEANLGGFMSSGNTDEWGVSASVSLTRKGPKWTHQIEVNGEIKEEDKERTTERGYARYTARRSLALPRLFAYGRVSFERDRFQGISTRFFESVGLGYQLIDTRSTRWDFMLGPGLRQTDFSDGTSTNEPALFVRTRLEWEITDTLMFSQEADVGWAEGNSTVTSTTALTSNLYGNLYLRVSFVVDLETDPPAGREDLDTYIRVNVGYAF